LDEYKNNIITEKRWGDSFSLWKVLVDAKEFVESLGLSKISWIILVEVI